MLAAILLQGDPRFCSEFDQFLENLKGFDQVDYFLYMWEDNFPTAELLANGGHQVVAPAWQHIDKEWALNKFKELLPAGHTIVTLELADQSSVKTFPIESNFAVETRQDNLWKMMYSLFMANEARRKYEAENNFIYDVVIRTRPDVAVTSTIDAVNVKTKLDNNPNTVITPDNKGCGHDGVWICDLFGMGTSETMTIYCDLYNQALDHNKAGVKFHPETLLGRHLERNGCKHNFGGFKIEFRHLGMWKDLTTGEEWSSGGVPGWHNKIYISNFGRWQ